MPEPSLILERLLDDPPVVHGIWDETGTRVPTGLWPTDRSCYEFLAQHCGSGSRTLETGSGLSTVLLAALGASHTCVTYSDEEVARIRDYCASHGIDVRGVEFVVGLSDDVLPGLDRTPLDLVMIDGGHGFPVAIIDWFYGAGRLVQGGIVVIDDINLPAPAMLVDYLRRDPRWSEAASTPKWVAFRRESEGSLSEDWWAQKFFAYKPAVPLPMHIRDAVLNRTTRRLRSALARRARR